MNQARAAAVIPMESWRRKGRLEWLIVSKAGLRSRRMRIVMRQESAARNMSLVIFRRAVSEYCVMCGIQIEKVHIGYCDLDEFRV